MSNNSTTKDIKSGLTKLEALYRVYYTWQLQPVIFEVHYLREKGLIADLAKIKVCIFNSNVLQVMKIINVFYMESVL